MKELRLLPLVVFAGLCLLLLKGVSYFFFESQVFTGAQSLQAQETQKTEDNPEVKQENNEKTDDAEKKRQIAEQKDTADQRNEALGPANKHMKPGTISSMKIAASASEIELLESLAKRRKQLNEREQQLKLKENLLLAAERQIDERITELKKIEAKIQIDLNKQDVLRQAQYKRLVKIYSSMKPKEAARIFDGLKMPVLVGLVRAMKAASGSQIMAKMDPDKARILTLKLAEKEAASVPVIQSENSLLPKVDGEKPAKENQ